MYTKEEASKMRQEFWTTFGKYMSPVFSADGEKVNWINYKTGELNISFKMDADNKKATIALVFSHNDDGIRELYYEQLLQLQKMLPGVEVGEWIFSPGWSDDFGRPMTGAYIVLEGVNIFNKEDWPALISFFKSGITALDEFWSMSRYAFEVLR